MGGLLSDIRFSLRQLVSKPGFAIAAILTLALGIGANTAVFSVLNGYLLKPLPYPQAGQLMQVSEHQVKPDIKHAPLSVPNYLSIEQNTRDVFSSIGAYTWRSYAVEANGKTQRVQALAATSSLFDTLGVKPWLGHGYSKNAQQPGRGQVVILSYRFWQQLFGTDTDVIGRTVKMNGKPYTIIGVMPRDFGIVTGGFGLAALWTPYVMTAEMKSEDQRRSQNSPVIARLKPDVSLGQANARLASVLEKVTAGSASMQETQKEVGLEWRARPYRTMLVGGRDTTLYLLQAAVLLVLLIACVNVANLLLARILGRTHELAMRSTLGATRGVLARQLLIEGLCLAVPGGLIGMALGWWTLGFVAQLGLGKAGVFTIAPDWRVGLFTFGAILLVTLVISLLPIRHFSRTDLQSILQEGGRTIGGGRGARRIRAVLATAEMAIAAALLAGAGLLLHSFIEINAVNPGFRVNNVLTVQVTAPPNSSGKATAAFYKQLQQRVSNLPGVISAGIGSQLPLNNHTNGGYSVEGRPNFTPYAWYGIVDNGYFKALGLRLLRGRLFDAQDTAHSRPVVVIDEVVARQAFPHENPIGRTLNIGKKVTIIGVVAAMRSEDLTRSNRMGTTYVPLNQSQQFLEAAARFGMAGALIIHTSLPPYALAKPIKTLIAQNNAGATIGETQSMHDLIARNLQDRQSLMILILAFGAVALALAVIGVYGVMSYAVEQRTTECGVRLALGALPEDLLWLVLKDGLKLLAVGLLIGLALAVVLGYLLSARLFGVAPFDPVTLAGTAVAMSIITLLACYLPARRAAKLDPAVAIMDQ
ncbi:MAG TPA: ABC transporter permease [Gammaproteobacteria bacterium]|nr:ABC transporter permease [Gammaproteobacteria bacterium]